MPFKFNKIALMLLLLQLSGLISCGSDEPEADLWDNAPGIVFTSKNLQPLSAGTGLSFEDSISVVQTSDAAFVSEEKSQAALNSVSRVSALSVCEYSDSTVLKNDEPIPKKTQYLVRDLLPLSTLYVYGKINTDQTLTCQLGLRLTNSVGSTRTRWLPRFRIQQGTVKQSSISDVFTLSRTPKALCSTFVSEIPKDISEVGLTEFLQTQLGASTRQKCHLVGRTPEGETLFSKQFDVAGPTDDVTVSYSVPLSEAPSNYLSTIPVVRARVRNNSVVDRQYSIAKVPGQITVRMVLSEYSSVHISSPITPTLTSQVVGIQASQIIETEADWLFTLSPNQEAEVVFSAAFGWGCGTTQSLVGFDFSFGNIEALRIRMGSFPVNKLTPSAFLPMSEASITFPETRSVGGYSGRLSFHVPWKHGRFASEWVIRDLPQAGSCWTN